MISLGVNNIFWYIVLVQTDVILQIASHFLANPVAVTRHLRRERAMFAVRFIEDQCSAILAQSPSVKLIDLCHIKRRLAAPSAGV
jgi:hypothetical protein